MDLHELPAGVVHHVLGQQLEPADLLAAAQASQQLRQLVADCRRQQPQRSVRIVASKLQACHGSIEQQGLAAACKGAAAVRLLVDVGCVIQEATWRTLFSTVAASPSVTQLEVTEYTRSQVEVLAALHKRTMEADMHAPLGPVHVNLLGPDDTKATSCSWLAQLAASPLAAQLTELRLQLLAPLPVVQQPWLLWLHRLHSLHITKAPARLCNNNCLRVSTPVLLPGVLARLHQLTSLQSLECCVAAVANSQHDGMVAVTLQQLFVDLGRQLTQLKFGTSARSRQLCLSAPLVAMPALRSLTCLPGFSIDVDDALEWAGGGLGSSDSSSDGGSALLPPTTDQLAPSLSSLVLSGSDAAPLLRLLVARQNTTAAAPVQPQQQELQTWLAQQCAHWQRRQHRQQQQLERLELNACSFGIEEFEMLGQLQGLRELQVTTSDAEGVRKLLRVRNSWQLQGLTLLAVGEFMGARPIRLMPEQMQSVSGLTSLSIAGPQAFLSVPADLEAMASSLPGLVSFSFRGQVRKRDAISALPAQLQQLSLWHTDEQDTDACLIAANQLAFAPDACSHLTNLVLRNLSAVSDTDFGLPQPLSLQRLHNLELTVSFRNTWLSMFWHPLTALRGLTLLVEFDGRAFDGEQHLLRPSIELLPFACPELRNLSLSWRALNLPAARPLPWDGEADLLLTPPMDTGDLLGPLVPLATCLTSLTLSAPMACSLALDAEGIACLACFTRLRELQLGLPLKGLMGGVGRLQVEDEAEKLARKMARSLQCCDMLGRLTMAAGTADSVLQALASVLRNCIVGAADDMVV